MNGKVCAVCSHPVSPAPAPSAMTATIGAAANPICSADCAVKLDHAKRLNLEGEVTIVMHSEEVIVDLVPIGQLYMRKARTASRFLPPKDVWDLPLPTARNRVAFQRPAPRRPLMKGRTNFGVSLL